RRRAGGGLSGLLFLATLFGQLAGPFLRGLCLFLEGCLLIGLAVHLSLFRRLEQEVSLVGPAGFSIRIKLDRRLGFLKSLDHTFLNSVEFLLFRLLVGDLGVTAFSGR